MKNLLFILLALLVCLYSFSQEIKKIDIDLQEEMQVRTSDELIRINIIMKAQYEQVELHLKAAMYRLKEDKRTFVVSELKNFAKEKQKEVMSYLNHYAKGEIVTEIKQFWIYNGITCNATKEVIEVLSLLDDILIIGFDKEISVLPEIDASVLTDPIRGIVDNVLKVNAEQVWALGYEGEGVIVAVLDTGINYDHQDLKKRMWTHPDYPNHGWNFVDDNNDPMDDWGHGTHCAGTVAGDGTAGTQTGIAPKATIMAVKIIEYAPVSAWCSGIEFSVEHGAHILSLSLGSAYRFGNYNTYSLMLRNTMVNTLEAGVIASVAAGNEGNSPGSDPIPYNCRTPGNCPPPWLHPDQTTTGGTSAVVSVGATDINDVIANFSSKGPITWQSITGYNDYPYNPGIGLIRPDIVAPGVNVTSLNYANNSGYIGGWSGTSMATPCVAGIMALMLSKNPELTPAEICQIIETTAVSLPSSTSPKGNIYGSGRIDAYAAVLAVPEMCNNGLPMVFGTITQNTTWNTPIFVSNITVQSGVTLTIKTNVICNKNASITIQPGGKLIIDGGTLTNACAGEMWGGIVVSGDATKPMTQNDQGYVQIKNNGKIVNATCGIYVNGGGIVETTGAQFLNNKTQVQFGALAPIHSGTSGTFTNTYFFVNNSYFGNTSNFVAHLIMDGSGDVLLSGCDFTGTVITNTNNRIVVKDAHIKWIGNNELYSVPVSIQSGASFTNTGTIKCDVNTGITVEPRGKLFVDGGTLTNASVIMYSFWKGVTVKGDLTKPITQANQGYVELRHHGHIDNAICGITVNGGGIVDAYQFNFDNNKFGVYFKPKASGQTGISGKFIETDFSLTDYFLDDFVNFDGLLKMESSGGVQMSECRFQNKTSENINHGIIADNTPTIWTNVNEFHSVPVVIQSGATLTNTGYIRSDKNTEIIVQPGGKIIVDGGTFGHLNKSGHMYKLWQGITVNGTSQESGEVSIINNGKIENASCGIWAKSNGKITATDAHFVNNTVGVALYPGAKSTTFKLTNFELNDSYFGETGSGYYGDKRDFSSHIFIHGCILSVQGCTFSSTAPKLSWGNRGIYVLGTALEVKEYCPINCSMYSYCIGCPSLCNEKCMIRTTFSGFNAGISIGNFEGPWPGLKVRYCKFENIYNYGIYLSGNNYPELIRNEFYLSHDNSIGIYLESSTGYKVEENIFKDYQLPSGRITYGTVINNSGTPENEIYKNKYEGVYIAQNFTGRNSSQIDTICAGCARGIDPGTGGPFIKLSGLQSLCNTFDDSQYEDIRVGYMNSSNNMNSIRSVQGALQSPAGNLFFGTPVYNIDNALSQHNLTYYYDANVGNSYPIQVTSNVFSLPATGSNGCPSKAFTMGGGSGGQPTKEDGEWDLGKALSQYDEWNAEYEYWLAKFLAFEGKEEDEKYKILLSMVSYYSTLKDNYLNSIIAAVMNFYEFEEGENFENDEKSYALLRELFAHRNHYIDNLSIVETYIAENNYRMALAIINNMHKQFELSEYGKLELEGLQTYVQWRQQLYETERNLLELNDKEIDFLVKYVKSNLGRGVVFANNILCMLFGICLKEAEVPQYIPSIPPNQTEDEFIDESVENSILQINNKESLDRINVIPNPTTGVLRIESGKLKIESIQTFDIYGRKLMSHPSSMSPETVVNISHLQSGIYFIKVLTEQGEVVKKVVKQ